MQASDVVALDRDHLWHPYAPPVAPDPLYAVLEADGVRLVLDDGHGRHEVIDAMASWWAAIHGYRHPVLDEAVRRQVSTFSHVMLGGLTHEPAAQLGELLTSLAPPGLNRVFLADSGSVAMEVALKVARQVGLASRPVRTRFAALRGAYHGDTWGAMSVCDPDGGMHHLYAGQVQPQLFLPRPPAFAAGEAEVAAWTAEVTAMLAAHRDELAAVVVEPVLQGAGGMLPWSPLALRRLRELADEHQVLLVADEIATGFGRTGRLWGCDWAEVVPDVMALGKAMTGGYLTQAAVLTTDRVARAVADGPAQALMHGPTFMGNPLASAVSLASVGLVAGGGWRADVARAEQVLTEELAPLRSQEGVSEVRLLGAVAAVELRDPVDVPAATRAAVGAGVWLRPFRNLVYAMPPYLCTEAELRQVAGGIQAAVAATTTGAA